MDARTAARVLGAGRLAVGVAMLAAPKLVMGGWVGRREAGRTSVAMTTRAFGAREVLLGFLALHTAERPPVAARTLRALALCDATDLALTVAHRRELPSSALALVGPLAGGAALAQLWAANELT